LFYLGQPKLGIQDWVLADSL